MRSLRDLPCCVPDAMLCAAIAAVALGAQEIEQTLLGRTYLEASVIAILFGVLIRAVWRPGARWTKGIEFSAKTLLETPSGTGWHRPCRAVDNSWAIFRMSAYPAGVPSIRS